MFYKPFYNKKLWVPFLFVMIVFFGLGIYYNMYDFPAEGSFSTWYHSTELMDFFLPVWVGLPIVVFWYLLIIHNYLNYLQVREIKGRISKKFF